MIPLRFNGLGGSQTSVLCPSSVDEEAAGLQYRAIRMERQNPKIDGSQGQGLYVPASERYRPLLCSGKMLSTFWWFVISSFYGQVSRAMGLHVYKRGDHGLYRQQVVVSTIPYTTRRLTPTKHGRPKGVYAALALGVFP